MYSPKINIIICATRREFIKVSSLIYNNIPAGLIADQASFELECNCPTLTLTSGANTKNQNLCSGEPMNTITYQLGGENVSAFILDSNSLPLGISSSIEDKMITISGTPSELKSENVGEDTIEVGNKIGHPSKIEPSGFIAYNSPSSLPNITINSFPLDNIDGEDIISSEVYMLKMVSPF